MIPDGRADRRRWFVALTEYGPLTPYSGGIGTHYAALLPALVRRGVEIDLALFSDADLRVPATHDGVRLVAHRRLGVVPAGVLPVVRAIDVRAIAGSAPYDAMILPEWGGLGAALPASAPLVTNLATSLRLVTEISGVDTSLLPSDRRRAMSVQNRLESAQIRRSRGVIPISRAMAERTGSLLGSLPRMRVVRNCVDVAGIRESARRSALPAAWPANAEGACAAAPRSRTVLFLGRLERRKGVLDAARAFGAVARSHPHVRFVFAGASGDQRFEPRVQDVLALAGGVSRASALGHVPGGELHRAIAEADVVVCPSRWEGFGQVALEAKALGTALIATSGSGYDDFCRDESDCLLVAPGDPTALATALRRLLDDDGLVDRLRTTAADGIDRYGADAVAADFEAAVDELLGHAAAPR